MFSCLLLKYCVQWTIIGSEFLFLCTDFVCEQKDPQVSYLINVQFVKISILKHISFFKI